MIAFDCECGEPLAAAAEHAGRRVKCPRCGEVLAVPAPPEEPPVPAGSRQVAARRQKVRDRRRAEAGGGDRRGEPAEPKDPVERMMAKAHAELAEDEAKRSREWRPVVFTPGIVGGLGVFVLFSVLAVVCLLLLMLYPAIGCFCVALMGLFRAILSFLGRGVD